MSRLDEKWTQAGGVVGEVEKHIEDKLDALIARKAVIKAKTDTVFAKQEAPIDEADKALDALDAKLSLLSNGGPTGPLPGSGSSLVSPTVPPAVLVPDTPPANPAAPQPIPGTFRAEAEQQIAAASPERAGGHHQ